MFKHHQMDVESSSLNRYLNVEVEYLIFSNIMRNIMENSMSNNIINGVNCNASILIILLLIEFWELLSKIFDVAKNLSIIEFLILSSHKKLGKVE